MTLARASTDEERLNGGVGVSDTGGAEIYFIPLYVNSPDCLHTLKTYVLIRYTVYPSSRDDYVDTSISGRILVIHHFILQRFNRCSSLNIILTPETERSANSRLWEDN
jgi:hypothetical protein